MSDTTNVEEPLNEGGVVVANKKDGSDKSKYISTYPSKEQLEAEQAEEARKAVEEASRIVGDHNSEDQDWQPMIKRPQTSVVGYQGRDSKGNPIAQVIQDPSGQQRVEVIKK